MAPSEKEVEKERNIREKKDVQTNSKQPGDLSRFKDDKRKPDQETVAASGKDVESKKCQGPRLPKRSRSRPAVPARRSCRGRSYRLSLFFVGFLLSKLPSPGLSGLYL